MLNEERGKIWSLPYIHSRPQLKLQRSREPLSNYLPDLHRTAGWTLLLSKPKPKLKYLPSTFEEKKRERKKWRNFVFFHLERKPSFLWSWSSRLSLFSSFFLEAHTKRKTDQMGEQLLLIFLSILYLYTVL